MGVLDAINGRWGRGTVRLASVPVDPQWGVRREMMSQSFNTRVDQLWTATDSVSNSPRRSRVRWPIAQPRRTGKPSRLICVLAVSVG